jgi:hypothetical protein
MFSLNFNIRNPYSTAFKNLWCRSYVTPFKNKFIELEFYRDFTVVSFTFNYTMRQSHAGLDTEIGLFGYNARLNFYDSRHWNAAAGRWMHYTEELGEY